MKNNIALTITSLLSIILFTLHQAEDIVLGSLLGAVVPAAHMRGAGMVGGRIAGTDGMVLWVFAMMTP